MGRIGAALLAVVALVFGVAVATPGEDPYRLVMELDNANGLREGADVRVAGVKAGEIGTVELTREDRVRVVLELDRDEAPVGRDATVAIQALNLLGRKRVELKKGDISSPAPDGYVLPAGRVATSTDLDQVLSVLDNNTRTRLAVLVSEAGRGVFGRQADISEVLDEMPGAVHAAQDLLRRIDEDDRALGSLVDDSSSLVARVSRERRALTGALESMTGAASTFAERRVALRDTLAETPQTLRSLTRMLATLRQTTVPLGPAAEKIADVAPQLEKTLAAVGGFTDAAEPMFAEAVTASPKLTALAKVATPVLGQTAKTTAALNELAADNKPLSDTLMKSADNIIAVVDNWSHAIQFRDSLSHVFRGSVSLDPAAIGAMLNKWRDSPARKRSSARRPKGKRPAARPVAPAAPARPQAQPPRAIAPPKVVQDTVDALQDVLGAATGGLKQEAPSGLSRGADLLDFLLAP